MNGKIPVIDLFAGPGGLAEGISAFTSDQKAKPFNISLSVEKEYSAWKTLRLRAFTRQFDKKLPPEYYDYIAGKLGNSPEDELFKRYPDEAAKANLEALQFTLGEDSHDDLDGMIQKRLEGTKNWILIGGPPCQAYSLAGRARNKANTEYRAEDDNRHFLYRQYLRIIEKFHPAVFVMENVKGILSSKVNGELVFHNILSDLKDPSKAISKKGCPQYKIYSLVQEMKEGEEIDPHDFIICSEKYGIPQARHRVILLGVREDIVGKPNLLTPQKPITVANVIGDIPRLRSGHSKSKGDDSFEHWLSVLDKELQRTLKDIPNHDVSHAMDLAFQKIKTQASHRGSKWLVPFKNSYQGMPKALVSWYRDNNLNGIINHESRGHMDSDLVRYLFCSSYVMLHENDKFRTSPTLANFPSNLLPAHKNVNSGKFVDRFKVQERNHPASTITCHIAKDGHYFIHYDPTQCRSLTVREAARIQTFPDNYFFEGNRTEQYVQVGNAVPPLLAKQIADIVYKLLT